MKNNEKAEINSGLQGFMCYNVIAKSVISRVYVQFQYNQKSLISINFKLLGENKYEKSSRRTNANRRNRCI